MRPSVSVVLPCYNAAHFLPEAIASVTAQRHDSLELIVIDDGSTDNTPEVAALYGDRLRFVRQENAGPSAARNRGLRMSRGEYIAFIDADDLWPAGKLELQLRRLASDPELDLVAGRIRYVHLDGTPVADVRTADANNAVTHIHLGSAVFRRRAFERVGLFDEDLRFSEDQDWYLRAREEGLRITILAEITLIYRLHEGNMTHDATSSQLRLAAVLKKSLDRRRRRNGGLAPELRPWSSFDESLARTS